MLMHIGSATIAISIDDKIFIARLKLKMELQSFAICSYQFHIN